MAKRVTLAFVMAALLTIGIAGAAFADYPWETSGDGDGHTANGLPGDFCTTNRDAEGTIAYNHHSGKETCRK